MPHLSKKYQPTPAFLRSTVLLALAFLAVAPGLPLRGQGPSDKGRIYDLFRTSPGTNFDFKGEFTIPAGFFGEGSQSFSGKVALKGVPLGSFRDHKTGDADFVVERKTRLAPAAGSPSPQKVELELAALSLQSTAPIKVRVGKKTELWNVKVGVSPSHPSTGNMAIKQRNAQGGTADWDLTVYPLFTFTRQIDKAEKTLDTGTLKLASDAAKQLTLQASNSPWSTKNPRGTVIDGASDNFFLGVKNGAAVPIQASSALIIHIFIEDRVITIFISA
jgi:hypothetical protein